MRLVQPEFELTQTSPVGKMTIPMDYNYTKYIDVDMGDLKRHQECVITFHFKSNALKVIGMEGSCNCMGGSRHVDLPDGTQQVIIKYDTGRIGVQDRGSFTKTSAIVLNNRNRIKFKLHINESK